MTTPTTNISIGNIQTEFGGSNPASLSEYYRGGNGGTALVPANQPTSATDGTPISTSGLIRVGMFRGTTKNVTPIAVTLTISASTSDYNIRTAAVAARGGVTTEVLAVTVNVSSGVYVYSSSTGTFAMDTGTGWVSGSTITLNNAGVIVGQGGAGGAGAQVPNATANSFTAAVAGSAGGTALRAQYALSVNNTGTIAGGGGGGGGGGAVKTDTSGKGTAVYGAPGSGGGGGRGGSTVTAVGAAGLGSTAVGCNTNMTAGTAATTGAGLNTTIGSGAVGGSRAFSSGIIGAGTGGTGGGWGTAGAVGTNPDTSNTAYYNRGYVNGAGGGVAGAATSGSTAYITWVATGTRFGAIG